MPSALKGNQVTHGLGENLEDFEDLIVTHPNFRPETKLTDEDSFPTWISFLSGSNLSDQQVVEGGACGFEGTERGGGGLAETSDESTGRRSQTLQANKKQDLGGGGGL